jgi:hypothetical protein
MVAVLYVVARPTQASAQEKAQVAADLHFRSLPIAEPPGLPDHTYRNVNAAYQHIQAWISAVGAGIAINDFTGSGDPDDMCLVDTRSNSVIVTPVPGTKAVGTFKPFVLTPSPALPYNPATMAPMGCVPGDFAQNGRMDLLVYYWGRTPVIFMLKAHATQLSAAAYQPVELIPPPPGAGPGYHGPLWNTNAVAVADFSGDGHPDLFVGNYFPNSPVLNAHANGGVVMPSSLSNALNGGGDYILQWSGLTPSGAPKYTIVQNAFPARTDTGWTLAAATADLDNSMLPDLYVANDFGHDRLFVNVSTPGHIRFINARGSRSPIVPKSKTLGDGSFKGMGADFTDLDGNGKFDILVSNITTPFGLQESNFAFMDTASSPAQLHQDLIKGIAPFSDQSMQLGLAQSGWSWDVKAGDFANNGQQEVVQTTGFVKGTVNLWPELQELAMTNDNFLSNPANWPNFEPGTDIAGHQCLAFFARGPGGRYVNISQQLGLCVPTPTRGVAIADTRDNGALDFAVARQWGAPAFYQNDSPDLGKYLDLDLYLPAPGPRGPLQAVGTPAIGAVVRVTTAAGHTYVGQVDAGSGGSGKSAFGVHFGLGSAPDTPVRVTVAWRGVNGQVHDQTVELRPGLHTLLLGSTIREVTAS